MARDRPSPYSEGAVLPPRNPPDTVLKEVFDSPTHGEGQALALRGGGGRSAAKKPAGYRSAGACPPRASRRRDLPVSIPRERPMASRRRVRPPHPCRSGSSEALAYCQAILNRSGSGEPELQRWARWLLVFVLLQEGITTETEL